jgi:hypothetical protein
VKRTKIQIERDAEIRELLRAALRRLEDDA